MVRWRSTTRSTRWCLILRRSILISTATLITSSKFSPNYSIRRVAIRFIFQVALWLRSYVRAVRGRFPTVGKMLILQPVIFMRREVLLPLMSPSGASAWAGSSWVFQAGITCLMHWQPLPLLMLQGLISSWSRELWLPLPARAGDLKINISRRCYALSMTTVIIRPRWRLHCRRPDR